MMKFQLRKIALLVVSLLAAAQAQDEEPNLRQQLDGQSPSLGLPVKREWVRRYNGPAKNRDYPIDIAVDNLGYIYVTGLSIGASRTYDIATIKYTPAGDMKWLARYNSPGNGYEHPQAMAIDGDGNVYVTGWTAALFEYYDYVTIKYDSMGIQQWVARYDYEGATDIAHAIALDRFGNIYVTGYSYTLHSSSTPGASSYATIKYNHAGVLQWVARYGSKGSVAAAIAIDPAGDVYVTGHSTSAPPHTGWEPDYATVKYNSAGKQQWVARYDGPGHIEDRAEAVALDNAGNVYVTGVSYGLLKKDFATIKYNRAGVEQWVARYNGPYHHSQPEAMAIDGSGNVYVTGYTYGLENRMDYVTIKYNGAGVKQWIARYDGPANSDDRSNSIAVDRMGNVYVTGYSNADFLTLKYNSAGVRQWGARYNGPKGLFDSAIGLYLDAIGNVYVTGSSNDSTGLTNYVTIKYSSSQDNSDYSRRNSHQFDKDNTVPAQFDLAQNYPNPFSPIPRFAGNPNTTIRFDLPVDVRVKLTVYNLRGELVRTLADDEMAAGYHHVTFEANHLAAGIYFYRLAAGTYTMTRKMILQK